MPFGLFVTVQADDVQADGLATCLFEFRVQRLWSGLRAIVAVDLWTLNGRMPQPE